jgi:hypothetical protein
MSTFYYLACDEHMERTGVLVGRYGGGSRWHDEPDITLAEFFQKHRACDPYPYILCEADERFDQFHEIELTSEVEEA